MTCRRGRPELLDSAPGGTTGIDHGDHPRAADLPPPRGGGAAPPALVKAEPTHGLTEASRGINAARPWAGPVRGARHTAPVISDGAFARGLSAGRPTPRPHGARPTHGNTASAPAAVSSCFRPARRISPFRRLLASARSSARLLDRREEQRRRRAPGEQRRQELDRDGLGDLLDRAEHDHVEVVEAERPELGPRWRGRRRRLDDRREPRGRRLPGARRSRPGRAGSPDMTRATDRSFDPTQPACSAEQAADPAPSSLHHEALLTARRRRTPDDSSAKSTRSMPSRVAPPPKSLEAAISIAAGARRGRRACRKLIRPDRLRRSARSGATKGRRRQEPARPGSAPTHGRGFGT